MICNRNFPASLRIGAFIMEKFRVGIIGATGMVGQRFVLLTANHPWFTPVVLAASAHSAGKTYAQAIEGKWHMAEPIPESVKSMIVMDAEADAEEIARQVDFVFCAVNMKRTRSRRWKRNTRGSNARSYQTIPPTATRPTCRWSCRRSTPTTSASSTHSASGSAQSAALSPSNPIAACKAMFRHCTR